MKKLILIATVLLATAFANAAEWLHADDEANPVTRVSAGKTSPLETFPDGITPTAAAGFHFIPVTRLAAPEHNAVLLKPSLIQTTYDTDKTVVGHYVAPDWVIEYELVATTLAEAQAAKLELLEADQFAAYDAGYTSGPYTFPLTEAFFQFLCVRARGLNDLITSGAVGANRQLTFSDIDGREVSVGLAALESACRNYTIAYLAINEIEVAARGAIGNAATPVAVNTISWSF